LELRVEDLDIHFPELTPRSPSEVVVKNQNQKLMRLSTCKAAYPGNKISPRNRDVRSPNVFRFSIPNDSTARSQEPKAPITPSKLSLIFQGAETQSGVKPVRLLDTPGLRQSIRENTKMATRMKDSLQDLGVLPGTAQTDRQAVVGSSVNVGTPRARKAIKENPFMSARNSPERMTSRNFLMTPSKKSGQTFRHLLSTYQKQYLENVAITTPSMFMATELMNTDVVNQPKPFKSPWSVIEEHTCQNSMGSTPTNKDSNKERLKRRLKKSSFPAVMAKQRVKKEKIVSLSVRNNYDLDGFDDEDHRKIFDLKKEKEFKRTKAIKALDTYNFNLFKPTTLKAPPIFHRDYISI